MTYNTNMRDSVLDSRDIAIIEEIRRTPFVHHNALKRTIVDERHVMARRTFDLHVRKLIKEGEILLKIKGNKKLYGPKTPIDRDEMIRATKQHVKLTEMSIGLLERSYPKMSQKTKTESLLSWVNQLMGNIGLMALLPCITFNPKDRELSLELISRFQECLFRVFALVLRDPEMKSIAAVLFSRLSDRHVNREEGFIGKLETL